MFVAGTFSWTFDEDDNLVESLHGEGRMVDALEFFDLI
jgi:hypothetical protein